MAEKPFGWRPFSEEYRAHLLETGFDQATIDRMEDTNAYRPDASAIWASEFGLALLLAVTKHLGAEFMEDVRRILADREVRLSRSERVEDRVEGKILADELAEWNSERLLKEASAALGEPSTPGTSKG